MKIAYFDTISGIAGDMTLAAFVSAGLPVDFLGTELQKLGVSGFELVARHVRRSSIDAVHIDVAISHQPHMHRDLHGITTLIDQSTLSSAVKEKAISIFRVLADAEARVHNTTPDAVHFHEVGALDSIVDIVGAAICLDAFGIQRIYSSPIRLGSGGLISTQHGMMPSPAPATLEILKGYPVVFTSIAQELTTPTGAAIIKALSAGILDREQVLVETVGYGAGTREFAEVPNFLRVVVGTLPAETAHEELVVIETNIDDMNPQMYPVVIEQLLTAGAHDAYLVPIIMKKGRPGILLSTMATASVAPRVVDLLYRETSTIGLRIQHIGRQKLPRRQCELSTSFGTVKAKAVVRDGREVITAEFEECRRIARETGRPVLEVIRLLDQELRSRENPPTQ